jgi:hypothetical protein
LLLIACSLVASTALAAPPDWVVGDSAEYPNARYLVGRGVGATDEEAQNRARGDLATIFEVRIQVLNEDSTTAARSDDSERIDRLSTQQVSARTDKVISGISIAKIWRDPETTDFHALAVLSRSQASASLGEELAKIDAGLQQDLQAADDATDALLRIGLLQQALQASIKREGFQATLKVIDPTGRGLQSPISQASVQQSIDDTLRQIRIAPKVVDDAGAREFASLLKGGLAAAGFLTTGMSEADLVLEGKLTLADIGRRDGWNWIRATVEVRLVEKVSRRVRGTQTWPLKASAQDARTARSRVLIEVEKLFRQDLRSAIIQFASR